MPCFKFSLNVSKGTFSSNLTNHNFHLFQLEETLRKALAGNPSNVNVTSNHDNLAYEEDTENGSTETTSYNQN